MPPTLQTTVKPLHIKIYQTLQSKALEMHITELSNVQFYKFVKHKNSLSGIIIYYQYGQVLFYELCLLFVPHHS